MHRSITDFVHQLDNQPILQHVTFPTPVGRHMAAPLLKCANNILTADAMTIWYQPNMVPKLIHKLAATLHPSRDEATHYNRHI